MNNPPPALSYDAANLPTINLPPIPNRMRPTINQKSARVLMETRILQNLIKSYFQLTKTTIIDMVPKTIMAFLVLKSKQMAQCTLIEKVYRDENLD